MSKKINAALKKAYYYFGFKKVVSYDEVKGNIEILKNNTSDEEILSKIESHENEIKEFCEFVEGDETFEFPVKFAKVEPRKSWEAHTADFPKDIFTSNAKSVEEDLVDSVEPVSEEELVDSVEHVDEEPVEEDLVDSVEPVEEEETTVEIKTAPPKPIIKQKSSQTKIYINGELLGYCEDPVNFTQEMREKRRNGEVSFEMNIT